MVVSEGGGGVINYFGVQTGHIPDTLSREDRWRRLACGFESLDHKFHGAGLEGLNLQSA